MKHLILCAVLFSASLHGEPRRNANEGTVAWVGIRFNWIGSSAYRAMQIHRVSEDGPAAVAGLQAGDLVTTIDGVRTNSIDGLDFLLMLADRAPGDVMRFTIVRGGRTMNHAVVLGRLPETNRSRWEENGPISVERLLRRR